MHHPQDAKTVIQTRILVFMGVVLAIYVLKDIATILKPVAMALFLCFLALPLRDKLVKIKIPKTIANVLVPLLMILSISFLIWFVWLNLEQLTQKFPQYQKILYTVYQNGLSYIESLSPGLREKINKIPVPFEFIGKFLGIGLASVISFFGTAIIVCILIFFLLLEIADLPGRLKVALGGDRSATILSLAGRINEGIWAYVQLKTQISLMVAGISTVILLFFGVKDWAFWGMLTFFCNFIPYVGSFFVVVTPGTILFLDTEKGVTAITLIAILTITQRILEAIVEPHLAGKKLNLSPLWVIISVAFWAWLWGFVGLILAVPFLLATKITLEHFPSTENMAQLLGEESIEPS